MRPNEHIVGIDLGTTNSVIAVLENDQPRVIANSEGLTKTPSVVAFLESGEVLVGEIAKRQSLANTQNTVTSIKRLMGRDLADVLGLGMRLPFEVTDYEGQLLVKVGEVGYTPSQVSAFILMRLKEAGEEYLGASIGKAIITVPAYFDDLQRQATYEAGRLAGLEVLRLINEPTAAAMAYGMGRDSEETIVVYDWGGGTFDLTILDISGKTFEVRTSNGDTQLGGDDIDDLLVQHLLSYFASASGLPEFSPDPMALRRLKEAAEKAKCELSIARQTVVSLPFFAYQEGKPLHFEKTVSRSELEELVYPLVERTVGFCHQALEDCDLKPSEIDKVLLVGGSTRIPLVQEMLEEFFGKPPFKGINPDEVVAMGAATQGGVMGGKLKEVLLLDVTPHTLGIEILDGRVSKLVEKNSTIPVKVARLFTTTEDNQDSVLVHVVQGEGDKATENRSLGKFALTGVQESKAGVPRIQVTFHINADGMVEVSAEDLATHQQESISLLIGGENDEAKAARERTGRVGPKRRRTRKLGEISTKPMLSPSGTSSGVIRAKKSTQSGAAAEIPVQPSGGAAHFQSLVSETTSALQPMQLPAIEDNDVSTEPIANQWGQTAWVQSADQAWNGESESAAASQPAHAAEEVIPLSDTAKTALQFLREERASSTAVHVYEQARRELQEKASKLSGTGSFGSFIRMLITLGDQSEAKNMLLSSVENDATNPEHLANLFDMFLERFPEDDDAIAGRAQALARLGLVDSAIADYERVCSDERGSDVQVGQLIELYQAKLAQDEDPNTQLKLVKLLVRERRFDEATEILQQLCQIEAFRVRALKILGLCFWQKGLHYLAWQKFQQLPLTEEVKDILYRLASDMEETEQLLNARCVLEYLNEADCFYRDVDLRLKKIDLDSRLQSEERDASVSGPAFLTFRDSRFTILEEINRGSMGIVYRAKDKVLEEIVALKVLNEYMTTDPSAVERFKREARAAKKLSHPNIVRIHDMYEYGNKKLLSMEYIQGEDVKTLLRQRKVLALEDIVLIARGVCDALAYAHQSGIAHRDIKPANIMVTTSNQVRVTDFGIAKFLLSAPDSTGTGTQILGTPLYMSPEQIRGDHIDARSDIYSFGATLYEMASGRPPFPDGNIEYHHLHTPPVPLPDSVVPPLRAAVIRCLEKDVSRRFQTIAELRIEIEAAAALCTAGPV